MERASRRTADAAAQAGLDSARAAVDSPPPGTAKGAGSADPLIGDLRRAGLLPLLVLHFAAREPAYGNQLIERIAELTGGALRVNPNTMYPLLRSLEAQGLVAGEWEHPERRSRRFYRVTDAGPRGAATGSPASSGRGWTASPRSIDAIRGEVSADGRAPGVDCRARARGRGGGALVRPASAGRPGSTASATSSRSTTAGPPAAPARLAVPAGRPRPRARAGRRLRAAHAARPLEVEDATMRGTPDRHVRARAPTASRSRSRSSTGSRTHTPLTPVVDLLFVRRAWNDVAAAHRSRASPASAAPRSEFGGRPEMIARVRADVRVQGRRSSARASWAGRSPRSSRPPTSPSCSRTSTRSSSTPGSQGPRGHRGPGGQARRQGASSRPSRPPSQVERTLSPDHRHDRLRRLRRRRLRHRGRAGEDGDQARRLRRARRGHARPRDPRLEHVRPVDHRDRRRDQPAGQGRRLPLLLARVVHAPDRDRRGRGDLAGDRCRPPRTSRRRSARRRCAAPSARASSSTGS